MMRYYSGSRIMGKTTGAHELNGAVGWEPVVMLRITLKISVVDV